MVKKKTGMRTKIRTQSGFVLQTGLLSNEFIADLKIIDFLGSDG